MPDMAALRAKYFADDAALAPGEALFPYVSAGNTVTALIDGRDYFGAIRQELVALTAPGGSGKFFYFTDWLLELINVAAGTTTSGGSLTAWPADTEAIEAFILQDGTGITTPFIDELEQMAAAGTDVRALVWMHPFVLNYASAADKAQIVYQNMVRNARSAHALRQRPGLQKKVCLNSISHSLGAMHIKMVVCGDSTSARAYLSGIDFCGGRFDDQTHPGPFGWHDVGLQIEGPAVQGAYGVFRINWNELLQQGQDDYRIGEDEIENFVDGTPSVPSSPPFPAGGGGTADVQILRTVPQMNFAWGETDRAPVNCIKRLVSGFRRDPWEAAPNGVFAFEASLKRAIEHAETYIYIEDQAFWGQTIMDWLRIRLAARPNLKLIMVYRADPEDEQSGNPLPSTAINKHLASAGNDMSGQVAFYARTDGVVVHSKVWIIDDEFLIAGSANMLRRSLYTDGELSAGVIHDNDTTANLAVDLRKKLWGEHCGLHTETARQVLDDPILSLKIWDPTWGGVGAPPAGLLPVFQRKKVPFVVGAAPDEWDSMNDNLDPLKYDIFDADSRLEY